MKVHYITFLSKGEPFDKGLPLGHLKEKLEDAHRPHFDKVTVYTTEDVPTEFRKEYDERIFETRFNPGYHNVGYGAFKPYLILKTLEETDCDVVFWRDGNVDRNPIMLEGVNEFKENALTILENIKTDIFVPFENPNWSVGNTTPSIVFEEIVKSLDNTYTHYPQMNAALIICKKTDYIKDFLQRWLNWMRTDTFFYANQSKKHSNYNINCGDQGILNVLLLKEIADGNLPIGFPFIGYQNRTFTKTKLYKMLNVADIPLNTETVNEHTFFPAKLRSEENSIVVDLGCSEGGFLKNFKSKFKYKKYIGVEASPINYEKIKNFSDGNTFIINAAVCSEKRSDTNISFVIDENDSSVGSFIFDENSAALKKSPLTLKRYIVPTIKISDIFTHYNLDKIDLLKIDIEGAEWEILNDLDSEYFEKIEQISVEFHDFIDPTKKEDTQMVINRLKNLGYEMISKSAPWFYETDFFDCTFYKTTQSITK
jgi:FkbM family methyltransferase